MGIRPNGIMTIWEVREEARYTQVQFSTAKKVKDGWETDFSGYALLNGDAKTKLYGKLEKGTKIVIREFDVTKKYVKDKNREFVNVNIWDADLYIPEDKSDEKGDSKTSKPDPQAATIPSADFMSIADGVPDLPFE